MKNLEQLPMTKKPDLLDDSKKNAPTSPERREFIKKATIGALGATIAPEIFLNTTTSEGAERKKDILIEISPENGEGIYKLLSRYELNNPLAFGAFQDINSEFLTNGDIISAKEKYKIPVLKEKVYKSLLQTLRAAGIEQYAKEIHEYNMRVNPEYKKQVHDPSVLKSGQVVYVPQWGTGFYDENRENSVLLKTSPQKEKTYQKQIDNVPVLSSQSKKTTERADVKYNKNESRDGAGLPYAKLKKFLSNRERLSEDLKDYCFIIDPGHGGDDKGATRKVKDGVGNIITVTEAPIVYDVSLRILRNVLQHGGEVYFTHFASDFGIKDEKNPHFSQNTTYNMGSTGRKNIQKDSSGESLKTRKLISKKLIDTQSQGKKTIFISMHADSVKSSIDLPITVYIDYKANQANKNFAKKLAKYIPNFSNRNQVKEQGLGVLRNNPANLECLIELANLNNVKGAWRLRDHTKREEISQIITDALRKTLN